jgi:Flp pilus assembly protein TadG
MRITSYKRSRSSGGIAVLLTSVMIIGAMMAVGMAIDVGMMYAVKTKLSAAADAAALAGTRALGRAGSGGPSGQTAAQTYFDANMPTGYMLATNIQRTVTGPTANGSVQTMTVNAQADLPLLFTRFIQNTQTIKITSSASRQDVNLMMVLDRSGSMNTSNSCVPMVAAAQDFTKQFVDGRDQLGLIVFGGSWDNSYAPNVNFKSGSPSLSTVIGTITCGGNTGSAQAIWQAYQKLKALPGAAGALNVIVFFTDGQPNGLTADWPINTPTFQKLVTGQAAAINTPSYANSSGNNGGVGTTVITPWYLGYAPSGCSAAVNKTIGGLLTPTITGFIARNGENQSGIKDAASASIGSDGGQVANSSGCWFNSGSNDAHNESGINRVHEDIAFIPDTDTYGNKTTGYWDNVSAVAGPTGHPAAAKLLIPGAPPSSPYGGKVMLDHYDVGTCGALGSPCGLFNNNIDLASMNAAEDAAFRARSDANLHVMIMCIGLGGAADAFPGDFLEHVANTQNSDLFPSHSTEPSGQYVYVNGPGELGSAFQQIASYVQRLTN